MKYMKGFFAVLIISTMILSACATPQPPPTPPAPPKPVAPSGPIEYTNAGEKIEVPMGVAFIINVSANPTTGYTWEVGFDQSLLKLVKRYTAGKPSMPGSGGYESFEFEGIKKGDAEVYLNYKRPFEQNDPNIITKKFHVVIK